MTFEESCSIIVGMWSLFRGKRAMIYIFFELLPAFLLGLMVFVGIILMFQILRLTEFALVHGVAMTTILKVVGYICISMLPALLPMSLLFAVLLTYGRLAQDSELVALKASGLSMWTLMFPAAVLAFIVGVISAQTSFNLAPWGNRQFEVLFTQLSHTKAGASIRAGTFSEGFFDMVIYAKEVDSDRGILKNVFISDENSAETPVTLIARAGQIIPDPDRPGHEILLRLSDGEIHKKTKNHTKIHFSSYDVYLSDPIEQEDRQKSPQSWTMADIQKMLDGDLKKEDRWQVETERHKRWAISILCFVFAAIGAGLGSVTDRRSVRAGNMTQCIGVIIAYWIFYLLCEGVARNGQAPAWFAIWVPNLLFGIFGVQSLRKNWN